MSTLINIVEQHVSVAEDVRFVYLKDGEIPASKTYPMIVSDAKKLAAYLTKRFESQTRVLLIYPPGLDFISSFLGCLYAGMIAVPAYPLQNPRHAYRLHNIIDSCEPRLILGNNEVIDDLEHIESLSGVEKIATEVLFATNDAADFADNPLISPSMIAFLQYTSGSTGKPKGVMVSHANLLSNLSSLKTGWGLGENKTTVLWLPFQHDLGLIGGVLSSLYNKNNLVLLPPVSVIEKPYRWLKALTDFKAYFTAGPNFAYQLCVNKITEDLLPSLDLSSVGYALAAAEPNRYETKEAFCSKFAACGFKKEAYSVGYGLAENTLHVTTNLPGYLSQSVTISQEYLAQGTVLITDNDKDQYLIMSAGRLHPEHEVVIVNPLTNTACPEHEIGEIWIHGRSVALGYWANNEATKETFQATIDGGNKLYLRTGDLGFIYDNELYVTGRQKDLIIIDGRNIYPQDLEAAVDASHDFIKPGCSAAFSVDIGTKEGIVLCVEIKRTVMRQDLSTVIPAIRHAIAAQYEVAIHEIKLLSPNGSFKTTSGKIQRKATKAAYLEHKLECLSDSAMTPNNKKSDCATDIHNIMAEILGIKHVSPNVGFSEQGGTSIHASLLAKNLQDYLGSQIVVSPTIAYDYPTLTELVHFAEQSQQRSKKIVTQKPVVDNNAKIAIIGIGCRLPGKVANLDDLWQALINGVDAVEPIPSWRWDIESCDEEIKSRIRHAGILENIDKFDASFFNISPKEARQMDPQHRLLLEVMWGALENALIVPETLKKEKVGVYIGSSSADYKSLIAKNNSDADIDPYFVLDNAASVMAGRIAYYLGTQGPAETIDTACSSSLVAVDQACQALQLGNANMAIVGSVNVILYPENSVGLARANMLSPTNRCHTFCQSADGYVRAEGCAVVILKRLDDALKDGDLIHAIIQGTAVNQDGASSGLTVPNLHAQKQLLQEVLAKSNLNPNDIDYIEAHGSATSLGDPIEIGAINEVFGHQERPRPLHVGSIKSNIGHLEAAAGMAGLLKTVAALENKAFPANINLQTVNNKLDLDSTPIEIVRTHTKWHAFGQPRRAGVSAFGFSGTNAHVILEEAPPLASKDETVSPQEHIFVLSAKTKISLDKMCQSFLAYLEQSGETIANICYTATTYRSHFSHRIALITKSKEELLRQLKDNQFDMLEVSLSNEIIAESNPQLIMNEYLAGKRIDWHNYYKPYLNALQKVRLPTYCFDQQRYWLDIKKAKRHSLNGQIVHDLLGIKQAGHAQALRFINQLDVNELDYLKAHCIFDHVLFPGAAFIETALAAGANLLGDKPIRLTNISLFSPLALNTIIDYETSIEPLDAGHYQGTIYARSQLENEWKHHVNFSLEQLTCAAPQIINLTDRKKSMTSLDIAEIYQNFSAIGLNYGEAFQSLHEVYREPNSVLAAIKNDKISSKEYFFHPALLDSAFQAVALAINNEHATYIPAEIASINWYQKASGLIWAQVNTVEKNQQSVVADITLTDNNGRVLAEILGFKACLVSAQHLENMLENKTILDRYIETYDVYTLPMVQNVQESDQVVFYSDATADVDINNKHIVLVYEGEFEVLIALAKRLLAAKPLSFTLITNQGYCINFQDEINYNHTKAIGFWKSLRDESTHYPCYLIDVAKDVDITPILHLIQIKGLPEPQVIVREKIYIPRLVHAAVHRQLAVPEPQMYLSKEQGIDSVYWQERDLEQLANNELRIAVRATALNFRDVLSAMNLYPGDAGDLGYECVGEVLEIGSQVRLIKPGQRVLVVGDGLLAGQAIVKENQITLIPDDLSAEQAAAIPIVFLTANYGFNELAKIKKGQKVLIHAASGGVGLAAIEFARLKGAIVYVTASKSKQAYLKTNLRIEHCYDSRTLKFSKQILADTQGEGVDVVLNSLTSAGFIDASLACLKKGGVFLEIGKINIYSKEKMSQVRPDVNYHVIEIDKRIKEEPQAIQVELKAILQLFSEKKLNLIPLTVFPVTQAIEAFHYLQQAKQIGKVVLSIPKRFSYDSSATYLITGGTGGLGLELAKHLLKKGVRHLALISRNNASEKLTHWIEQQNAQDIHISHYQADVCDKRALTKVFDAIKASSFPLKGIFHTAGIIKDGLIKDLNDDDFNTVLAPKVIGSLNLHELSQNMHLDCFVLFSSITAMLGNAGQANYAAANAFMDGLALKRHHLGLPALSINWGAFATVGMAVGLEALHKSQGIIALDTQPAFTTLDELLNSGMTQVGVVSIDWAVFNASNNPYLSHLATKKIKNQNEWMALLEETANEYRTQVLGDQIKNIIAEILTIPNPSSIDSNKGFFELGMDSLMAVEFKTLLQAKLGDAIKLKNTIAFDYPQVGALATYILGELTLKENIPTSTVPKNSNTVQKEDIAIIGLSGEFPGAETLNEFWQLLVKGQEGLSEVPSSRWDIDEVYDANTNVPGKMVSRRAGFINDIDLFDARFFSISPKEANYLDPQQRLLLKHSWLALEAAGIAPQSIHSTDVGVFVGISTNDYNMLINQQVNRSDINAYIGTGNAASTASGRISYVLGLQGPSLAIDTACSSSLVALNVACDRLQSGECTSAIVGGVNAILSPELSINFSKAGMLAPDGKCKTFDERADGYVRGEGCGVVVLKRVSDAIRDKNPIWAVIKASGINQDGASSGLTVPNGHAQERLLSQVLAQAQLTADDIDYVECHGTGTKLGDPIEVNAIGQVYGNNRAVDNVLKLGSVKTNIGHLEAAAGISGLIKVVLALKHQMIPAHLNFSTLNSNISLNFPAEIVTKTQRWETNEKPRRAAISSFGFSGTNAHVILEEAPAAVLKDSEVNIPQNHLFVLSAKSANSLQIMVSALIDYLEKNNEGIEDICYSLAVGRNHFSYRLALIVNDKKSLLQQLKAYQFPVTEVSLTDELVSSHQLDDLAKEYLLGKTINWSAYYQPYLKGLAIVNLPGYCFDTSAYWFKESTASTAKQQNIIDYVQTEWEAIDNVAFHPFPTAWAMVRTEHNTRLIQALDSIVPQVRVIETSGEEHYSDVQGIIYPVQVSNPEDALTLVLQITRLVQKLIASNPVPKLIILTNGLYSGNNLAAGSLLGFIKSALQEYPLLTIRLLDTDDLSILQQIPETETFLAYNAGQLYRHRLTVYPHDQRVPKQLSLHHDASYLITGGLGALGQVTMTLLLEKGAKHLILVNRRKSDEQSQAQLNGLAKQYQANIETRVADVSNQHDVELLMHELKTKNLKGIFHLAGVLNDNFLSAQTQSSIEQVFIPKAMGAWYLHQSSEEQQIKLDYFVLFSSIASSIGSPGQTNYAAANSFLDQLAQHRSKQGLAALSIAWGPWNQLGMAKTINPKSPQAAISLLSVAEGSRALIDALEQQKSFIQVANINWDSVRHAHSWLGAFVQPKNTKDRLMLALKQEPKERHKMLIQTELAVLLKEVLGLKGEQTLNIEQSFFDLGIDSLMALEYKNRLQELLGEPYSLSNMLLFQQNNIKALSDHIIDLIAKNGEQFAEAKTTSANSSLFVSSQFEHDVFDNIEHDSFNKSPQVLSGTKKLKILFLHGTAIDSTLTQELMKLTSWIHLLSEQVEWTFIDGPYKTPPVPLMFQSLYKAGKYVRSKSYHRWDLYRSFGRNQPKDSVNAMQTFLNVLKDIPDEQIEHFLQQAKNDPSIHENVEGEFIWRSFAHMQELTAYNNHIESLDRSLNYIKKIYDEYGPFDGIAGMCEGASIAGLFVQQLESNKIKLQNNRLKFLLSFSGWKGEGKEIEEAFYQRDYKIQLPSLHLCGKADSAFAQALFDKNTQLFNNPIVSWHDDGHVIPELSNELQKQVKNFIDDFSGEK